MRKRRGNIASQILKILHFVIQTRKHLKHIDFGSFEIPESLKISQTGRILEIRDIFHRLRISNCHFHRHLRYLYPLPVSQTGLFLGFCDILYSWYHKIAKTT